MLGEAPFLPAVPSPWGGAMGLLVCLLERRIPPADLDEHDPEYSRSSLPGLWLWASLYFRARVRGMHRVPAEGPGAAGGDASAARCRADRSPAAGRAGR
jgi:hypothetical protein